MILISGCSQKLSRTPTADEDQIPTVLFQKERGGIHIPSTLYLLTFKSVLEKKETVILLQIGKSTFTVNGVSNTLDSPPLIKNGRTLVPIRAIIEALGGTIGWDAAEKKVTISFGSTTIELWIGKFTAKVNGINTPIDPTNLQVVPEIIDGRTMLPLRFVAESLGCSVDWNATTKTITIKYPKEEQMTGDYSGSIVWDGLERTYLLHVPPSYDINKSMPLVIALHGGGGTAEGMMETITLGGFNTLADKEGFIMVYPSGVESHWNDCRNDMLAKDVENVDDVGFISALIDHFVKTLNVDPNRVYVTGMSNGAMMTHRLALELTDKIAAIATVAGNIPEDQLQAGIPKRAIPVLIISGTDDPIMPWDGGYVLREPKRGKVISVPETVKYWVNNNKCSSKPEISYEPDLDSDDGTRVRKEVYGNGANGTEVILYAVEGGGHTWPGGSSELPESIVGKISRDINANEVIWNFFKAQCTPSTTNLSFLKTQGKDIVNESGEKVFLKGVNFGCWLLWEGGALELPNNPEHQLRAEMEKRMPKGEVDNFFNLILANYILSSDFAIAKSMGMNFIRLPFHYRYVQENQLTKLDEAISWAKNNGIYVMLDLQAAPGSQNPAYHSDSDGNASLWSNTTYQHEFINLWKILAQRYKDEPAVVGYELLNEPVAPEGTQLVSLYQQAIVAIRAIDNKHIIFLDGNNYAYDINMFNPHSFGDNIVYVFHTYSSLAETQSNLQNYRTFQNNFNVPIMCNEYGGADEIKLTSYFQTEEIPYAPWGYKLSFITPDKTPFYYIPSNHRWRIKLLNKIAEWMKASEEYKNEILTAINIGNLSDQCKQDLIDILNKKGELTPATNRLVGEKYPNETNELKRLSLKVAEITSNYTVDALAAILQTMSENELTELVQSLQTQYWEKGTAPW